MLSQVLQIAAFFFGSGGRRILPVLWQYQQDGFFFAAEKEMNSSQTKGVIVTYKSLIFKIIILLDKAKTSSKPKIILFAEATLFLFTSKNKIGERTVNFIFYKKI